MLPVAVVIDYNGHFFLQPVGARSRFRSPLSRRSRPLLFLQDLYTLKNLRSMSSFYCEKETAQLQAIRKGLTVRLSLLAHFSRQTDL
ncbi:hypothetical protein NBRC111894_4544 [Sporolactobacillus inulinus]|uniref:Uncharacterized protein n=1 Tax=Sporolactobacillus inulinus TaxID=2078 RepID=A0A4Y1ZIY2_9BACL|nr:hypothetical protein NBRC111894_4544 [Sporolactobacillus inulinus]